MAHGLAVLGAPVLGGDETQFTDLFDAVKAGWLGSAITLAAGAASLTPTLGSELMVNGAMEVDANWNTAGTPTTNALSAEQAHGGATSRKIISDDFNEGVNQAPTVTDGAWYQLTGWIYAGAGTGKFSTQLGGAAIILLSAAASWVQGLATRRSKGTTGQVNLLSQTAVSTVYYDDISEKAITNFIAYRAHGSAFGTVTITPTRTAQTQVGAMLNYVDDNNYIIAYLDGWAENVILEKVVAGTWTTVATIAITYGAGQALAVTRAVDGTVTLKYNGAAIGTSYAITDAVFGQAAKQHGFASLYASNSIASYQWTNP